MYNQSPRPHCKTLGDAPSNRLLSPSPFQFLNPESSAKKKKKKKNIKTKKKTKKTKPNKAMPISSHFLRKLGFVKKKVECN